MISFPAREIWKAKAEPKCRFFAWLVMHDKALTADNMEKKNWQCDTTCALCFCQYETTSHLLTNCNYSEACWGKLANSFALPEYEHLCNLQGPLEWLRFFLLKYKKNERKEKLGYLFMF
jgi:hypothetical protein